MIRVRRPLLVLAGALLLLSLGLLWGRTPVIPGVYTPGTSILLPNPDGTYYVEITPGMYFAQLGGYAIHGAQNAARVTGLAATVLLWLAVRRGSRRLAALALAVGAVALPLGLDLGAATPGRLCYLAALVAAAAGVGLLPRRRVSAPT